MSFIEWNNGFLLGIPQFDEDHKRLISILNSAYDNFTTGVSIITMDRLLNDLVDYARSHFSSEEHWMEKLNYPHILKHKNEHDWFVTRVGKLAEELEIVNKTILGSAITFLNTWIAMHITETDADYCKFVNNAARYPVID